MVGECSRLPRAPSGYHSADARTARDSRMSRPPLRLAVLGAGTVGRAVVRGLLEHPERTVSAGDHPPVLAGIAVRDLQAPRPPGLPAHLLTDAPAHLVASPDTDLIVELLGGLEPARTLIAAALGAGKSVVTANKAVIATHGPELEAIARGTGATLRFEAAVAAGIPILGPLAGELAANEITRIRGIVNGTTNYILTAMASQGRDYADLLREAQEQGYAEADPTGDVEGHDAVNKLVILARLAFGAWLDPAAVRNRTERPDGTPAPAGISGVSARDVRAAAARGLTIRLVASVELSAAADGAAAPSSLPAWVMPVAIPTGSGFGRTDGVLNRIEVEGRPVGRVAFEGPGAGGDATSSAVLGDIRAIARGLGSTWADLPPAGAASVAPAEIPASSRLDGPDLRYLVLP
jgi:homoserine dehydrogenase